MKFEELTESEKKRRAKSGGLILKDFRIHQEDTISSREEILTDVLSNLMHLWARTAKDSESTFTEIYQRAVDHNQIELGFEQEFDSFPPVVQIDSECDCQWNSKHPGPEHSENCRNYRKDCRE